MAFPGLPNGTFDLVFSFDTTGSMSRVIDEVKGRVSDMIQRLQADIPTIRIGVIAHGDYCDKDVFYLEQHVDLTDNLVQLTDFVHNVDGTGGGDPEECYEYVLNLSRGLSWRAGSQRALVVIGDSVPHEPDYELNTDNLDWREEAKSLASQGVKIYGVQVFDEEKATEFFTEMATLTAGEHVKLGDFSNICDFIMAICYRERGADFLENYEAEVRAREARKGLNPDLEGMFGVLRRGDSSASKSEHAAGTSADVAPSVPTPPPSNSGQDTTMKSPVTLPAYLHSNTPSKSPKVTVNARTSNVKKAKAIRNQKLTNVQSKNAPSGLNSQKPEARYRHSVPDREFILNRKEHKTRWTHWKQVIVHSNVGHMVDPTIVPRATKRNPTKQGYRKKKLFPCSKAGEKALYEVAVQKESRQKRKKYIMFSKVCTIQDWSDWERYLLGSAFIQKQVNAVIKNNGSIWVRRFSLSGLGKNQRDRVRQYLKGELYKYAWDQKHVLQKPGKLEWAMETN